MALTLGELFGTIGLDDTEWNNKLEAAQGRLQNLGTKGAVIAGAAGVAIGAAMAAGVISAIDIDAGNDKLAASLGLTEKQAEVSGAAAGSLYANAYGESLDEVNGAVGAVMSSFKGMRDASQADIESTTAKILDLATAMEIDVVRAAQVAGQMVSSGLATDADQALDLLTASMQKVPAAVREDLLDAADEYGPFFSNLGISGENAMGMLVAASEKGMYGIDKTGDALKEFGIRATDMSDASAAGYELIGASQEDMTARLLAGGDTAAGAFQEIITGIQAIEDPVAQSQAALALFGTPLEDLSVTEIPAFLASLSSAESGLGDVGGAAERMGTTLNDNAATNLEAFKRGLTTTFVDIIGGRVLPAISDTAAYLATTLGPAIQDTANFLNNQAVPALTAFGQWLIDNQSTIATIAAVIGAVLLPVFVRLAVQAGVSAAAQVTAWALSSGGAIKTAAVYVAQSYVMIGRWVAMGAAAVVSGAQTVAVWALYRIEAIKGAAVYVAQSLRVAAAWVAMSVAAAASGAKTAAVWLGTMVASAVSGAASFVVQSARVVGGWVLMGAQSLLHAGRMAAAWFIALGPIGWVIGAIIGLVALVIANWDKISKFTAEAWSNVTQFVSEAADNIVQWLRSMGIKAAAFLIGAWNGIRNGAVGAWNGIVSWIAGIPGRVLSALSAVGRLYIQFGQWILSVKDAAVTRFLDLVSWVGGVPDRILSALGNLGGLLLNAGGQIMDGFLQGLKDSWGAVTDFVGGIGQWIADNKGPKRYDQQLLIPAGRWIMGGLNKGLKAQIPTLRRTLGDVAGIIESMGPSVAVSGSGRLGAAALPPSAEVERYAALQAGGSSKSVHAPITVQDSTTPYATAVKVARYLEGV